MEHVIEVKDFQKSFKPPFRLKRVQAVRGITFEVKRGEVFGFLGPNGAGKTTTIKAIVGLISPSAGEIKVFGESPFSMRAKKRIGFLPEQPYFYDYLKASELLDIFGRIFGMGADERKRKINDLLEMVGLAHASDRVLRKFSKGMLQRVGLAQALLNDPELVILDEPMSGLDPIGRKEFSDLIASLKAQGKTIFFSSHILADIERLCDRVVVLDKGKVKAMGDLEELLRERSWEKEALVKGIKAEEAQTWDGVSAVEKVDNEVVRIVFRTEGTNRIVAKVIEKGGLIQSVSDRRMSLEALVMKLTETEAQ
jgi:ABC-2 type transport system ATP-binding protein